MTEIIKTSCSRGKLIITEDSVIMRIGKIKEQTIPRASLTGIDSKMGTFIIYGFTRTLTFHRQGGQPVTVKNVPPKPAKQILALLNAQHALSADVPIVE